MTTPDGPLIIGLGEILWDCFEDSRRPGGAPANVAFQAKQLQARGVVCSRVGTDLLGDELLAFLKQQKLETEFIQRDNERATGTVIVDSTDPADPQYTITDNVAWDYLEFTDHLQSLMQQADAVCFGTLAQRGPQSRETILKCLASTPDDCLIVYDVNLRQNFYDQVRIERSMQMADVVKLNEHELRVLSDVLKISAPDYESFVQHLQQQFEVDMVCLTRGAQGCTLFTRDDNAYVPGVKVEAADAVGAGDAFTAALIVARLRNWDLHQSAQFANRVGAMVAGRPGAMPNLRMEFAELLQKYDEEPI